MEELVSTICLIMLNAHNEVIRTIHFDITSKSVQGAYENTAKVDFDITYGHSKDHRPDLKQFKIGALKLVLLFNRIIFLLWVSFYLEKHLTLKGILKP